MKKHDYPGKLIVMEGLDGSGKTTQLNMLKTALEIKGYATQIYKRKTSPLVAETIVRAKEERTLTPLTYSLIHAADFSDVLHHRIIPDLKAGFIVLFNKYVYTSIAKDYLRGQNKDWVARLYEFAIEPDLVFYLKIPLETALERMTQEEKEKDFYDSGMDIGFGPNNYIALRNFQAKLQEQYELMSKLYNFTVIDSVKNLQLQQSQIKKAVDQLLDAK